MRCEACDEACEMGDNVYPIRIGNSEIGYGIIEIQGCGLHVKLAIDRINEGD